MKDTHVGKVKVKTVESHLYLSEWVNSMGLNRENVKAKASKGVGVARDIAQILRDLYLGEFYFEALKLMRESMLISVLTSNLEVAFNLSAADIKVLDDVDTTLLRTALNVSSKSSRCLMFLELGILPVQYVIQKKRLGYLHHLLTAGVQSLAKQVFDKQTENGSNGTWVNLIVKDLANLKLNLSFDQISNLSKQRFKALVRNACMELCFKQLLSDKFKLSKGSEITYHKFSTQSYLKPGYGLSTEKMRKIYHTRCRETYLKCNYPMSFSDKECISLCDKGSDSERHIYTCKSFAKPNAIVSEITPFEVIFGNNVPLQCRVIDELYARLEVRKKFIQPASPTGGST